MTGRHGHHRRAQSVGIALSSGLTSDFASDSKLVIQNYADTSDEETEFFSSTSLH
jgi:hypothetical protein